jgi:signal transduction histidine kinase
VDGAADSLSADEASLMLVEGDDLRVASSTRTRAGEAEAWQQRARLGEGVAGWVAQTGSALSWDDAAFELPPEELRVLERLAGQIAVALAREGRAAVVGALQEQVSQARAHLVEVERLATIGQSMAGLVHDINAPLTALMTLAQMIQSDPTVDGTSRDRSAQIIQAAQRAQRLVRELLTMTKPRPPTFEAVDLNVLIK